MNLEVSYDQNLAICNGKRVAFRVPPHGENHCGQCMAYTIRCTGLLCMSRERKDGRSGIWEKIEGAP